MPSFLPHETALSFSALSHSMVCHPLFILVSLICMDPVFPVILMQCHNSYQEACYEGGSLYLIPLHLFFSHLNLKLFMPSHAPDSPTQHKEGHIVESGPDAEDIERKVGLQMFPWATFPSILIAKTLPTCFKGEGPYHLPCPLMRLLRIIFLLQRLLQEHMRKKNLWILLQYFWFLISISERDNAK